MPTMKRPPMTTLDGMLACVKATKGQLHTDTAFLGYLSDENIDNLEEIAEEGTVFGFACTLS